MERITLECPMHHERTHLEIASLDARFASPRCSVCGLPMQTIIVVSMTMDEDNEDSNT